jgi:hypothetical protein
MLNKIADAFLKNRAELLPDDIWGKYIVPPLFNRTPVFKERKSLRICGGRGCGKTMFIRYLCHSTRFSSQRFEIPLSEFAHVGLFWRPDTQFCALMKESWLGERDAQLAFIHYATLVILDEVARCFDSIANANLLGARCDLRKLVLPLPIQEYLGTGVTTIESLKEYSMVERAKLELWVQNPELKRPTMRRFDSVLEQIAAAAVSADDRLTGLFFRIFVDEFENLQEHQRRLVCDYVKHPRKWFNVCFAMRQHAVTQFLTSGGEQIINVHDVFTIDLEAELGKDDAKDFSLLAAEFLLLGVVNSGYAIQCPLFEPEKLVDESALVQRISPDYRNAVINESRRLFPSLSARDIARDVLQDKALRKRLIDMIDKGLSWHNINHLKAEDFILENHPEASIVAGAIVNRKKPGPVIVFNNLQQLQEGKEDSNFFAGLIENNLHGCLFYLYIGLPRRANLLYSGFERFCYLSAPNLRFFQQLCHSAFALAQDQSTQSDVSSMLTVSPEIQAVAAAQVGETSLLEVERLGLQGTQLLEVMTRLGKLFAAAHRRPSQSEVEINHFSIDQSDRTGLTLETLELIRQAQIWSVFYEERYTKNKSNYDLAQNDIIPNPIFSPYFRISYRKKKKITLTSTQVNILMTGSGEQFDAVLREYSDRWRTNDDASSLGNTMGLF